MFELSCSTKVFWLALWKLNPVANNVICNPVHISVNASSSWLLIWVRRFLLNIRELSTDDPIIFDSSKNLAEELQVGGATLTSELFHRLLEQYGNILTKVDTSPFKHSGLLLEVWHKERMWLLNFLIINYGF